MKYIIKTADEVNEILGVASNLIFMGPLKVTKAVITAEPDLSEFGGFSIKQNADGEHKHDGQDVEYTWTFTSPNKHKTVIVTEMNLVAGWNVENKTYKFKV